MSPEQKKRLQEAMDDLSPEQKKQLQKKVDGLSDQDKRGIENYVEQLSSEERDRLADTVQAELKGHRKPWIQHVPEGPGIPAGYVLDFASYTDATATLPDGIVGKLTVAARKLSQNMVVFRRRAVSKFSDGGVGNGILISKNLVLTARHVAETIAAHPADYRLMKVGQKTMLQTLTFVSKVEVGANGSGDPDLALVRISGNTESVSFASAGSVAVKQDIASLGASEFENLLPVMGTGIVTTTSGSRDLAGTLGLRRTVFGSSLRSFPGLSGSPVFNANGELVAVVLGGVKTYAKTGETVTRVEKGVNWETFGQWTWATPLQPVLPRILAEIQGDR